MKEFIIGTRSKYYYHTVYASSEEEAIHLAQEIFNDEFNAEAEDSFVLDEEDE